MHRWKLRYETEISWFVLVSVLDIVMTVVVLRYSALGSTRGTFFESNPIAHWVLSRWGITGMALFKMSLVAVVVVIAEIVGSVRPLVARLLLYGGTLVVAGVVVHSVRLLLLHRI